MVLVTSFGPGPAQHNNKCCPCCDLSIFHIFAKFPVCQFQLALFSAMGSLKHLHQYNGQRRHTNKEHRLVKCNVEVSQWSDRWALAMAHLSDHWLTEGMLHFPSRWWMRCCPKDWASEPPGCREHWLHPAREAFCHWLSQTDTDLPDKEESQRWRGKLPGLDRLTGCPGSCE